MLDNDEISVPLVLHLIRSLWNHLKGAKRQYILDCVKERCVDVGRVIPSTFDQTVQKAFNDHNSDRAGITPKQPLFHCGGKLGSGRWELHHDAAKAWMAKRGYDLA